MPVHLQSYLLAGPMRLRLITFSGSIAVCESHFPQIMPATKARSCSVYDHYLNIIIFLCLIKCFHKLVSDAAVEWPRIQLLRLVHGNGGYFPFFLVNYVSVIHIVRFLLYHAPISTIYLPRQELVYFIFIFMLLSLLTLSKRISMLGIDTY